MLFKFCHIFYLIHTPHSCERMCCVHTCVHVCVDACPKAIHSATAVNQSIHMIILCGMYTRVCALACVCMSRTQLASAVTSCGHHSNRIYISSPSSFSASFFMRTWYYYVGVEVKVCSFILLQTFPVSKMWRKKVFKFNPVKLLLCLHLTLYVFGKKSRNTQSACWSLQTLTHILHTVSLDEH